MPGVYVWGSPRFSKVSELFGEDFVVVYVARNEKR